MDWSLQADSWLQSKGIDPYYSLFPARCNVLIAGMRSETLLLTVSQSRGNELQTGAGWM